MKKEKIITIHRVWKRIGLWSEGMYNRVARKWNIAYGGKRFKMRRGKKTHNEKQKSTTNLFLRLWAGLVERKTEKKETATILWSFVYKL